MSGMNNIENGMVDFNRNIWGDDRYYEEPEEVTYFVAHVMVGERTIKSTERYTLEDAMKELESLMADNDEYDDAFVCEYDEDGDDIKYYDYEVKK